MKTSEKIDRFLDEEGSKYLVEQIKAVVEELLDDYYTKSETNTAIGTATYASEQNMKTYVDNAFKSS